MSEAQTKELECVDLILHADASQHPALTSLVNRLNDAYRAMHALVKEQEHVLQEAKKSEAIGEKEAVDVKALDARIEAVWNECYEALQRMTQETPC